MAETTLLTPELQGCRTEKRKKKEERRRLFDAFKVAYLFPQPCQSLIMENSDRVKNYTEFKDPKHKRVRISDFKNILN